MLITILFGGTWISCFIGDGTAVYQSHWCTAHDLILFYENWRRFLLLPVAVCTKDYNHSYTLTTLFNLPYMQINLRSTSYKNQKINIFVEFVVLWHIVYKTAIFYLRLNWVKVYIISRHVNYLTSTIKYHVIWYD